MEQTPKNAYVYLEFNGKLQQDLLNDKIFLRIVNLHKKHPLVQVNDLTFRGTYDNCLGTNIFLDEIPEAPITDNMFKQQTPIHMKHLVSQHKIINLRQVKLASKNFEEPEQEPTIKLNLKWNYKTLLEKFEDGTLSFDMLEEKETENKKEVQEVTPMIVEVSKPDNGKIPDKPDERELAHIEAVEMQNLLDYKYRKLKELCRRPVKREMEPELVEECDPKYKDSYELHNLKCQIQQPCNAFFEDPYPINEDTLSNAVDIDRCVLYGILEPSEAHPRILTNKEKNIVLSLDNFDNLSIQARYYVLKLYIKNMEEYVENCPKLELNKVDEFGRNPIQTLNIYKELVNSLRLNIKNE